MAAELWRLQWGGSIMDATTAGTAIEEWSNSVSVFSPAGAFSVSAITTSIVGLLQTYHQAAGTAIHPTVRLDYMKFNEVDINTGIQITDPTNVRYFTTLNRGGGSSSQTPPLSMSYRVSLDDGTRDRRSRGGYFVPRPAFVVQPNGRVGSASTSGAVTTADTFLDGINGLADLIVGVWSRAGGSFVPSTRIRIGDVPDNISRRRNELVEVYAEGVLSP